MFRWTSIRKSGRMAASYHGSQRKELFHKKYHQTSLEEKVNNIWDERVIKKLLIYLTRALKITGPE